MLRLVTGSAKVHGDSIHRTEKGSHKIGRWLIVERGRSPNLLDMTIFDDGHAIRHTKGLTLIVRHKDKGHPETPLQRSQLSLHP
jgi:hypothetical protein